MLSLKMLKSDSRSIHNNNKIKSEESRVTTFSPDHIGNGLLSPLKKSYEFLFFPRLHNIDEYSLGDLTEIFWKMVVSCLS